MSIQRSKADTMIETKPMIPRPEQMRISLPDDYEPLAAINQLEYLYSFSSKALQGLPANRGKVRQRPNFMELLKAQKVAKHNKVTLTSVRLPAKILCHMYNL